MENRAYLIIAGWVLVRFLMYPISFLSLNVVSSFILFGICVSAKTENSEQNEAKHIWLNNSSSGRLLYLSVMLFIQSSISSSSSVSSSSLVYYHNWVSSLYNHHHRVHRAMQIWYENDLFHSKLVNIFEISVRFSDCDRMANKAANRWQYDRPSVCAMKNHLAKEAYLPGKISTGFPVFPSTTGLKDPVPSLFTPLTANTYVESTFFSVYILTPSGNTPVSCHW